MRYYTLTPITCAETSELLTEERWLEASDRAQGKLCIHVEFECTSSGQTTLS